MRNSPLSNSVNLGCRNKTIAFFLIVTALRAKKATLSSSSEIYYCILSSILNRYVLTGLLAGHSTRSGVEHIGLVSLLA